MVRAHSMVRTHSSKRLLFSIECAESELLPHRLRIISSANQVSFGCVSGLFWLCIRSLLAMYQVSFDTDAYRIRSPSDRLLLECVLLLESEVLPHRLCIISSADRLAQLH